MYCDRCGTQLNAGAQFCVKCGKAIVGGVEAVPEGQGTGQVSGNTGAYGAVADGRVRRICGRWRRFGRLTGFCGWWKSADDDLGRCFFHLCGVGARMVCRLGAVGDGHSVPGRTFSVGIFLGSSACCTWCWLGDLFERAPWRGSGAGDWVPGAAAVSAGNALGIYTLWVLLPEESGKRV